MLDCSTLSGPGVYAKVEPPAEEPGGKCPHRQGHAASVGPGPPAEGPRGKRGKRGAHIVRATAAAAVGPLAVRWALGGMALGRGRGMRGY